MDMTNIATEQTLIDIMLLYLRLGFEHILPKGVDHILFILALFLSSTKLKPLLWQVSAFTVAHTLTLGLASLNVIHISSDIIEPLIAISIAYVAIENVLLREATKWRPLIVFVFGLFHGLGFAGVLGQLGMPVDHFVPSLLSFNIGVELAQLTLLVGCWLALHRFVRASWYEIMVKGASALIALMAIWWTIERVFLNG